MKKRNRIILLVDLSEYSENLVDFAFKISEIIDAKVILVHHIAPFAPIMADHITKDEIIKDDIEEAYSKLRKLAKGKVYNDDSFYVSQKPVLTILKELSNEHYFDWVFAGLKGTGVLKRLFMGSTTISIVDDSDLLTVAVPASKQLQTPKRLKVGVHPKYPLNKVQFATMLSAMADQIMELEFFTVVKEDEDEIKAEDYLSKLQEEFKANNPNIHLYKGNNAFDLLKERVGQSEDSFLVLQQGSRSLSDKIFRKFMINELVYNGQTPLLVLSK